MMYHSTTPLNEQTLDNPPHFTMPSNGTIHGDMLARGTIQAADFGSCALRMSVADDQEVQFEDGTTYTGKELNAMFKTLKKLAVEEYPEEFV